MIFADAWGYLTGKAVRHASKRVSMAAESVTSKLDKINGEEKALKSLRNLGKILRGEEGNGTIAEH